jgi:hypothetical protein
MTSVSTVGFSFFIWLKDYAANRCERGEENVRKSLFRRWEFEAARDRGIDRGRIFWGLTEDVYSVERRRSSCMDSLNL